jgi:hypothetical protein
MLIFSVGRGVDIDRYASRHVLGRGGIVKINDLVTALTKLAATSAEQPLPFPSSPTLVADRPRPRAITEADWERYLKSHGMWLKEG